MNEARTIRISMQGRPVRPRDAAGEPPAVTAAPRRALWRRPATWGMAVVVAAALWGSSVRIATGPAAGSAFRGTIAAPVSASAAGGTLRVALFNIHGCRGTDRRFDVPRTAECLRGFDFAGLNEVLGPKPLVRSVDQCQQLGDALGMLSLFAPTEARWWDGSFGNGMLSARPVTAWQRIPLPRAGAHTHRNMVLAKVDVDGRTVNVLLAHLDSRDFARREEQLRIAGELFLSLEKPAVLMGDMNSQDDTPQMRKLLATPGVMDAVAVRAAEVPEHRIDWILVRGMRSVAAGAVDRGASDHALYWAELAFE